MDLLSFPEMHKHIFFSKKVLEFECFISFQILSVIVAFERYIFKNIFFKKLLKQTQELNSNKIISKML